MNIRKTETNDLEEIIRVERAAFGYDDQEIETLVRDVLADPSAAPVLSLLAEQDGRAVGHILFSRAYLNNRDDETSIMILAPLAVVPEFQKQGVGGQLIQEGLKILKANGVDLVFVLGHIEYYPRYGFIRDAGALGFKAPYPIPAKVADAWMVQELVPGKIAAKSGKVHCADSLDKPEYWRE